LYFGLVAQAALAGKTDWRRAIQLWPWSSVQVLALAIVWVGLLVAIGLPFLCLLSFLLVSGIGISRFVILLLGGMLIWLLLPLLLSPHGIFVNGRRMWISLLEGARLTRLTLNSTGLLFLTVVVLSEGLDVLWRIPSENSWLALVGVAGHGFVTTGLLAATFIYYQDAQKWVHMLQQKAKFA
jgi:hypothetical protein